MRVPPYAPSWIDRLIDRMNRLPGRGWWVYPILLAAQLAYLHAWLWSLGLVPIGTIVLAPLSAAVYAPYGLAMIQYLDLVGRRAMASFRPALDLPDEEIEARLYELVTLPQRGFVVFAFIGALLGVAVVAFAPVSVLGVPGATEAEVAIVAGPMAILGFAMFGLIGYHTFRQLRLVSRIHAEAAWIDLFSDAPLYAFSRLTARTGLAFIAIGYFSATVNDVITAGNPVAFGSTIANFVIGTACFVIPLLGIHGRLVAEKARLVDGANRRITATMAELYGRVDGHQLAGVKDVTDALGGLISTRELVLKLPTWPWPPQLFRGFVTALALPVIIFLLTRQLGHLVT